MRLPTICNITQKTYRNVKSIDEAWRDEILLNDRKLYDALLQWKFIVPYQKVVSSSHFTIVYDLWTAEQQMSHTEWFYVSGSILDAFAKLRKVTINFVLSGCLFVYLSVRMEQLGSH